MNLTLWVRYPSGLVVKGHKLKPDKAEPKVWHKAVSWHIVWAELEAFRRWVKALQRSLNEGTCLKCHSLPVDSLAFFLSYKVQLSTQLSSWAPSHAIHCLFLFSHRLALCFRWPQSSPPATPALPDLAPSFPVSRCSAEMGTRHKATQTWACLSSTDLSRPNQKTLSCANNDQTWVWCQDLGAVISIHPASFQAALLQLHALNPYTSEGRQAKTSLLSDTTAFCCLNYRTILYYFHVFPLCSVYELVISLG